MPLDMTDVIPDKVVGTKNMQVLLVDDEPAILDGIERNVRSLFKIRKATNANDALEIIREGEFASVVSDYNMPGMNGIEFLKHVREERPNTTRMLLTGQADLEVAMAAVNEGNIFRFLSKPASPDHLKAAISDCVEQYRLVNAEKELLEQTLGGSLRALVESLSFANPEAFARANRIRNITTDLLSVTDLENKWEIEVAAMLSQLGAVTLPELVDKLNRGRPLSDEQSEMVSEMPDLAVQILENIPRLEGVVSIISGLNRWKSDYVPIGTKLVQLASDVDLLESAGQAADVVVASLSTRQNEYGSVAVEAIKSLRISDAEPTRHVVEVSLNELEPGMELAADITADDGRLLVGRGHRVTERLITRVTNFCSLEELQEKRVAVIVEDDN